MPVKPLLADISQELLVQKLDQRQTFIDQRQTIQRRKATASRVKFASFAFVVIFVSLLVSVVLVSLMDRFLF